MVAEKSGRVSKLNEKLYEFRAIAAYALRVLSGLGYKEICSNIYNITISGCSRLCNRGYELLNVENSVYSSLFNDLVGCKNLFKIFLVIIQ
jgi:D-alanyl-lipoteichoic acid acyltransferase DltB (MBOAT superfamily)